MHVLSIPNWRPMSDNLYVKGHWSHRYKAKKADADMIQGYALALAIPHAQGKRRVSVEVTQAKGRLPDPTNILKSLMDALVKSKLLVDDNATYSELGRCLVNKGTEDRTIIILEDVG